MAARTSNPWRLLRRSLKQFTMRFTTTSSTASSFLLPRTRLDYQAEVGDGSFSSAVMACVLFKARNFPEAELTVEQMLQQREEAIWTPDPAHDLPALVEDPNPAYSGQLLWWATVVDFNLSGNAYWLKARARAGNTVQLWYTPSTLMTPIWPEDGSAFLSHYEYRPHPTGKPELLAPEDVVHFRYGLDAETRLGVSPLKPLYREIFTDEEASAFVAALLKNLGVPGVIIAPATGASDDYLRDFDSGAAEAIKDVFIRRFTGDHRGEPQVMGDPISVTPLSFSPDQMQFRDIRRVPEERVSAVLGVPAIVAGLGAGLEKSTYSNYGEAKEAAWESSLIPEQRLIGSDLSTQLLPDFLPLGADRAVRKLWRVRFDHSGVRVLQGDVSAESNMWISRVTGGVAEVAEAREAMGLPVDESHHIFLRAINVMEVPAGISPESYLEALFPTPSSDPPAAPPSDGSPAEGDDDEPDAEEKAFPKLHERLRMSKALTKASARDRRWIRTQHILWDRFTRRYGDALSRALFHLSHDVLRALELDEESKALNDWPTALQVALEHEGTIQTLLPPDLGSKWFLPVFETQWALIARTMFGEVESLLSAELAWSLDDPVARDIIGQGGTRAGLIDLDAQTRKAVYDALVDGQAAGDGVPQLARRIEEYVGGSHMYPGIAERKGPGAARRYRAETIARTEAKFAKNVSTLRAYRQSDVVEALLVFDGADCGWTSHDDPDLADGTTRDFSEASQYPLAHPRCVRSFAPKVREVR